MDPSPAARRLPRGAILYVLWASVSIVGSLVLAGPSAESWTRVLVLLFLGAQLAARPLLPRFLPLSTPGARFVTLGTCLAAVVEGFHMISRPVFDSLRVSRETPFPLAVGHYAIDLLFTLPAYLVIFGVLWSFVRRVRFPVWRYVLLAGLGQTLGDGGLFYFLGSPAMLFFLPYPMSNYHAVNVLPYLAVREGLASGDPPSRRAWLVVPALVATYLVCGALIRWAGQRLGLA